MRSDTYYGLRLFNKAAEVDNDYLKGCYLIMRFKNEKELNEAFEAAQATLEMERVIKAKLSGKITQEQLISSADFKGY
ncbi:hypothetical protein [Bacillus sp. C1]